MNDIRSVSQLLDLEGHLGSRCAVGVRSGAQTDLHAISSPTSCARLSSVSLPDALEEIQSYCLDRQPDCRRLCRSQRMRIRTSQCSYGAHVDVR